MQVKGLKTLREKTCVEKGAQKLLKLIKEFSSCHVNVEMFLYFDWSKRREKREILRYASMSLF